MKTRETGYNRKMEERSRLIAYVEKDTKEFITKKAAEYGISVSDYVRMVLENDIREFEEG